VIKKMERFVSSLTDQEIECQLKDIFDWARVYKELLETEQTYRRRNGNSQIESHSSNIFDDTDMFDDTDDACEISQDVDEDIVTVDYELAQMIQQKVATFSAEKTREQLEKLKQIPTYSLSPEDVAQLQYEIETCELHLFELTGETDEGGCICPSCGAELETNAKFCGKCGKAIKGG